MIAKFAPEESWLSPPPGRGGELRIAAAYPNSYWVAMSNLGYQTTLRAFLERPGFDVRRVFWEGQSLHFPDGGRSLSEFDVVTFSVSYQPDMVHLPRMLEAGRLSLSFPPGDRPLVIGGGVALTINPEPVAPLFDLIVIGDSEPVLPDLMDLFLSGERDMDSLVQSASELPGVYIPSLYRTPEPSESLYLLPIPGAGVPPSVKRATIQSLDPDPARPAVVAKKTEFGSLYLLEISRGCPARCAFCAASSVCGQVRFLGLKRFQEELAVGMRYRKKIGLVGTAVSYHPHLLEIAQMVHEAGGKFSPSSIRLERLTPQLADLLAVSGHRTVALAPEAGTAELRATVGKGFDDDTALRAVDMLQYAGIPNVKLYFMVGLPGEADPDSSAIVEMVSDIRDRIVQAGRKRGKVGTISVSVNPFIPKPHTPFERKPIAGEDVLARRLKGVRDGLGRLGGVKVQTGSVRGAYLDALLSLGDRRLAGILGQLPRSGTSLKRLDKIVEGTSKILFERDTGDLPWSFIGND